MASMLPPPYGVAFEFDVVLFDSDGAIKTTPTIAAGDFVISKANGATANLTTTPGESPASSGIVRVQLSATEMEADKLTVKWHDASGAEWMDGAAVVFTAGQTFNTMDANIDSILADTGTDGVQIAADAITASTFDESTAFPLKSADTGATEVARVGADGDTLETISDQIDAAALEATAQSILADTAEIGAAGAGLTALATQTSVNDLPTNAELAAALGTVDAAVLAALQALVIDGTITWMQMQRVLLAFAGGDTTGGNTDEPAFLGQDGETERITTTMVDGDRTGTVLNGD